MGRWTIAVAWLALGCPPVDPGGPDQPPPDDITTLDGFVPFDPADFPSGPAALDNAIFEPVRCEPRLSYDPESEDLVPRGEELNIPCPPDDVCEEAAPCEAFATTICPETLLDGNPAPLNAEGERGGCASLEALPASECEQVNVCPNPNDVPVADEGDDPPEFTELEPLEPVEPDTPPGVITLVDNATRVLPPCYWDLAQDYADSSPQMPHLVPTYGDAADEPDLVIVSGDDGTPTNFVGAPDGTPCSFDINCRSDRCGLPDNFATETECLPKTRLSKTVKTDADPVVGEVNDKYFRESKGNDRWRVDVHGGLYEADVHAQGVFYPSVAWDINAGAEIRIDVVAGGNQLDDVVAFDAQVSNGHCGWAYGHEAKILDFFEDDFDGFEIGVDGLFDVAVGALGNSSGGTSNADAVACEQAFQAVRARERDANEALWDTLVAAALWRTFGETDAVGSAAEGQGYLDDYNDAVDDYVQARDTFEARQVDATTHKYGLAIADVNVGIPLWRPLRTEAHMGPFVMGAEMGVTGKAGIDVLIKSATDFEAPANEADIALGLEATPHVDIRGYMSVYGGIDIFLAGVEAGIQGELAFAGLYMPVVVEAGLVRDEVPIDDSPIGACIPDALLAEYLPLYAAILQDGGEGLPCPDDPDTTGLPVFVDLGEPLVEPTGAAYRVPYAYNVGLEGRFLHGEIKGFVRAKILGIQKTWTKTFVEWEGIRKPYITLLDDDDIFLDTYTTDPLSLFNTTLPAAIDDSFDFWIGAQRDMVYLPNLDGVFGPPGAFDPDAPGVSAIANFLIDSLQTDDHWVVGGVSDGFCTDVIYVP
ncbi:MAG: hypothetical protein AAGA48_27510 [Myxococcota bacterium]